MADPYGLPSGTSVLASPRVDSASLARFSNAGQRSLTLVGVVTQSDNTCTRLKAADNVEVVVLMPPGEALAPGTTVELVGKVNPDNTFTCSSSRSLSATFDMNAYAQLISIIHDPKFSSTFF